MSVNVRKREVGEGERECVCVCVLTTTHMCLLSKWVGLRAEKRANLLREPGLVCLEDGLHSNFCWSTELPPSLQHHQLGLVSLWYLGPARVVSHDHISFGE